MRARRGRGHAMDGIALNVIGDFLATNLVRPRGEIEADKHKCNLCGKCQSVCARHAIYVNEKRRIWTLFPRRCNLCLQCMSKCPRDALKIVKR